MNIFEEITGKKENPSTSLVKVSVEMNGKFTAIIK